MRANIVFSVCLVSAASIAGCVASSDDAGEIESVDDAAQAAVCPDVSDTDVQRSLVITDQDILSRFSFERTMDQIRTSAGVRASETSAGIFQQWMRTFGSSDAAGDCNDSRIDREGYGLACPRAPELKLASVDPFPPSSLVRFNPVGLFNRFDLAPSNGAHCGEFRIVYAMSTSDPNVSGRAFIIFEGALPNPTPEQGVNACLPVAQFWQDLSNDEDVASRAYKLEQFYFTGYAVPGFGPVVQAANYGLATNKVPGPSIPGQIRTNFFVDFTEWHLREFKLRRKCSDTADASTCSLFVDHVTVKTNPADEVFEGTHENSAAFESAFVRQVGNLSAQKANDIKMKTGDLYNEFESVSQRDDVIYANTAGPVIRQKIADKLVARNSTLTVDNILNRATTQTCAGCHLLSDGQDLGGGVTWPRSLFFVQIDEASQLSEALTGTFLPGRKRVLETFINDRCDGTAPPTSLVDNELTIGGSPTGSPN
ncbi:hypothetical protein [Sorangium sp. So ce131]|uniref:hypothetical protein n=1 Tax=Sorangium sp. So ce131 TaxID=3133282 RepID=UPI003F63E5B2